MDRIIIHWTAGSHTPSNLDKEHYHFIIAGDGSVVAGKWPVSANAEPVKGKYAAHTLNCNTGSIGVSVAAMAGAVERPFNAGKSPLTSAQLSALAALCRDLAAKYKIPVTRETVLSHAEVQPTLGIKQRGKWDIAWLPGMKGPGDPVAVGDKIRAMIADTPVAKTVAPKRVTNAAPAATPRPKREAAPKPNGAFVWSLGLMAGGYAAVAAWYNDNLAPVIDWLVFWK